MNSDDNSSWWNDVQEHKESLVTTVQAKYHLTVARGIHEDRFIGISDNDGLSPMLHPWCFGSSDKLILRQTTAWERLHRCALMAIVKEVIFSQ